jgi:hypothetical protein
MDITLTEDYSGYLLTASPVKKRSGRWAVSVTILKKRNDEFQELIFFADDGISYILKEEAEKESINLGKNLIKRNMVRF